MSVNPQGQPPPYVALQQQDHHLFDTFLDIKKGRSLPALQVYVYWMHPLPNCTENKYFVQCGLVIDVCGALPRTKIARASAPLKTLVKFF